MNLHIVCYLLFSNSMLSCYLFQMLPALSGLRELLLMPDEEVILYACHLLSWFTQKGSDKMVQAIVEAKFCPRLVELLLYVLDWLHYFFVSFFRSTDILGMTSSMFSFFFLVRWYRYPESKVVAPALEILGDIASGDDAQTQVKIKMRYFLMILGTSNYFVIKVVEHVTLVRVM